VLSEASGDKRFFCHDGCVTGNLQQLVECLSHMSEESYRHHVTPQKNDFRNWIRDVFGDDKLANDIAAVHSSAIAAKVISARITWLRKKLKQ